MFRVHTLDTGYLASEFAAAYLVEDSNEIAWIDNGTAKSVPNLLTQFQKHGFQVSQVKYIIITHLHLDHAGGTGALFQHFPNARVICHPRAKRHLVDPSKLKKSAIEVYGQSEFDRLYGDIHAISDLHVDETSESTKLSLGKSTLHFLHTRGHAKHHHCIVIENSDRDSVVFTGDSYGLHYPFLKSELPFVFISSSPTDFEGEEALRSFDKIVNSGATIAYLTHFGALPKPIEFLDQLRGDVHFCLKLIEKAREIPEVSRRISHCQAAWKSHLNDRFLKQNLVLSPMQWQLLALDIQLNGAGIAHVAVSG